MTTARAAGAAKGSASRGASRAGGGKRGKPIRTGRPGPVTSTESKEQKAKTEAPPPSHDKNVRPAGMRSRVGVRATTNGSPFADLRLGGTILSPAAHKNPEKAREERRKLWARLGANSTSQTGFAHLLENVEGEVSEDGDDKTQRGSGRGPSGTRQRGAGRATLRVGFTAHREKFAKALRLEVRFGAFPNHNTVYCPSVTTLVIKRKNTTYSTSRLFAHTVHPYSRLKTDTFRLHSQFFVDVYFWIDLGFGFVTAYWEHITETDDVVYVVDLQKIRTHYLRTWFAVDVLAALPIDYVARGARGTIGCSWDITKTSPCAGQVRVVFPKSRHTVCPYSTDTFFYLSGNRAERRVIRSSKLFRPVAFAKAVENNTSRPDIRTLRHGVPDVPRAGEHDEIVGSALFAVALVSISHLPHSAD